MAVFGLLVWGDAQGGSCGRGPRRRSVVVAGRSSLEVERACGFAVLIGRCGRQNGVVTRTGGRAIRTAVVCALATIVGLGAAGGLGGCSSGDGGKRGSGGDGAVRSVDGGSGMSAAELELINAAIIATDSGSSAVRLGDLETARRQFARAIEVNPSYVPAYLGMGEVYRLEGDFVQAERQYGRAAELEPGRFEAQYYHGLTLHLLNRLTDAIAAYLRALRIDPNDFQTHLNLAQAYYQLEEYRPALAYARRSVELRPMDGPARFNLATILAAANDDVNAVVEYQQAAELMPLSGPLLLNLSKSLGKLERFGEMRNTLRELVRTDPSAIAYERLGFAEFRLGNFPAALAAFERSEALDPEHFPALNGVAVCLLNQWIEGGQRDDELRTRAVDRLRRSLRINRDQPRITELLTTYGRMR